MDGGYLQGTIVSLGWDDMHPSLLPGATVELWRNTALVSTIVTGSSGAYQFVLFPANDYELHVFAPWHDPGNAWGISVVSGMTTTQDFDLRTCGGDYPGDSTLLWENETRTATSILATGLEHSSCSPNDTADAWWYFIPWATGTATVSLCGSAFDTTLAVRSDPGGGDLFCNDDACGLSSTLVFHVTYGQEFYVRVAGVDGVTGNYQIVATLVPDPVEGEGELEGEGEIEGEGDVEGEGEVEGEGGLPRVSRG